MRRHRRAIVGAQWAVVLFYVAAVGVPAFLPLPGEADRILNNLTRFAQFLFWGLWWPFVIVSTMVLGRLWCGVLCPEGTLTELSSRVGLGRPIPRWMKWPGWPVVAFALTTVFGQMTSVYEYPKPALLILGGSTLAAVAVGLVYGRGKRAWCRHLCPVSGVFGVLARIAPLHFAVDRDAWDTAPRPHPAVHCAPLIDIRRMRSAAECHMCGQCAGHRGAVRLAGRSPAAEILCPASGVREGERWAARLLVFGMLGLALGAFQWSASPWFVAVKQIAAQWLVERDIGWPLNTPGHWWMLTHYPEANDALNWLDGALLLAYVLTAALLVGGWARLCLALAARATGMDWTRLAGCLIPFAGASLFAGLSLLTTGQLAAEGVALPWADAARLALLGLSGLWSVRLAWRLARVAGAGGIAAATFLPYWAWHQQLQVW